MFPLQYVVAPCLGALIGYITNDIAIRMLFRPHTAKYVLGRRVPFTPGIIPKEKGRIAEAIGGVISQNLMNPEVLTRYLLSPEMVGKVRTAVEEFLAKQKENQESVSEFLGHYLSEEEVKTVTDSVKQNFTAQISAKLMDAALGEKIAHLAVEHVLNDMGTTGIAGIASFVLRPFLSMLKDPVERVLSQKINEMLQTNGPQMVATMIDEEASNLLSKPMSEVMTGHDEQLQQVVAATESFYQKVITDNLPKILESIDIAKIVRDRINEMDVNETECLIRQVMDKELKAIVWLGALLGALMGCLNLLVF